MVVILPLSLLGQAPTAIIHAQGGVWVNGYEAKDASAVFAGDLIETKPGFSATLNLEGSSVVVQPESVVKLATNALELDHGSVAVETSRSFKVFVHCITAIPVSDDFTQYEVTDLSGKVHVAARKKDVNVKVEGRHRAADEKTPPQAGSQGGSVREGEQRSYDESELCGGAFKPVNGLGMPDPKWIAAGAAGAGLLIWVLVHGGGGKTPMSTSTP